MALSKKIPVYYLFVVILIGFFAEKTVAQSIETFGVPFIEIFSPKKYGASEYNWAMVQDKEGVLFFGNNNGLLTFDGTNWELHEIPNSIVRSLAIDSENRIYLGSTGDFGYISYTNTGKLKYNSLLNKVPEKYRNFDNVWKTYIIDDAVYFFTFTGIYIYKNNEFSVISPLENRFHLSFKINNQLYIREWGKGIYILKDDELEFIANSDIYAQDRVYGILPFADNKLLFISRQKGLMLYDYNSFYSLNSPINQKVIEGNIYSSLAVDNKYWILGGATGIYVINNKGEQVQFISNKKHLDSDGIVYTLYLDRFKNLWAGTYGNISRINLFNPFTTIDVNERVSAVYQNKNEISLGTKVGLYSLKTQINNLFTDTISPVLSIPSGKVWDIEISKNKKLVGNAGGIYEIGSDGTFNRVKENLSNAMHFTIPKNHPQNMLVTTMNGLLKLDYEQNNWRFNRVVAGLSSSIIQLEEYPDGVFWTGNNRFNLFKFQYDFEKDSVVNYTSVGKDFDLPEDNNNILIKYKNELLVCTNKGVYHYVPTKEKFEIYSPFEEVLRDTPIRWLTFDEQKQSVWYITSDYEVGKIKKIGKAYKKVDISYNKVKEKGIDTFTPVLYSLNEGILIGVEDGAIFYREKEPIIPDAYNVSLRKIMVGNDSLVHEGGDLDQVNINKFNYSDNKIRFDFSALFFEEREQIRYSYQLEGNEDTWSAWSAETSKEYNNLWEGKYTFKVKSKNIYEKESEITTYSFRVSPPFYRTWWAYILYVISVVILIYSLIKLNSRRLAKENEKLERVIKQRTVEIQQKQGEILSQNEELRQNQEELQAQRDYIGKRNEELEIKNQQIEYSIQSAETIQKALLPAHSLLSDYFKEYFLIYKPRDIVSGDFYWTHQQGNTTWLVVADCTGHGVPGAFMTLLGKSILDKIIKVDKVSNTADILTLLDENIRELLQGETQSQRGMDLILLKIENAPENYRKIQFTGAKNNLYLWQPSVNKLEEYKADRKGIGTIVAKQKQFTEQSLLIEKGSLLFLCTDGLQDQNNKMRARFGRQRLINIFSENASKSLVEQRDFLLKSLNLYMKDTTQRDDILVMGIKV